MSDRIEDVSHRIDWEEPGPPDCPPEVSADLRTAAVAAVEGGLAARPFYRRADLGITDKGIDDPVTEADHAANDAILGVLDEHQPADAVRSEESPPSAADVTVGRLWIVDPLDGTKEFIAQNGEFAVMVGLAAGGTVQLGAVLRPEPGRLYLGIVGIGARAGGAWVADVAWEGAASDAAASDAAATDAAATDAAHVSVGRFRPLRLPALRPARLRMVRSRSHPDPLITAVADGLRASSITSGSVGLKCALVAEGEAEIYVHPVPFLNEWDTCAPEAVLRGAGGLVSDCSGDALRYGKRDPRQPRGILAARADVWNEALPLVRKITSGKLGFDPTQSA